MSSKTGRVMLMLAMFLITSLAPFVQSAPSYSPNLNQVRPSVTLSVLEPQTQNATISSTTGATMTYTADLTVTKPPLVTVTVHLAANCSAKFPTSVTPDTIAFTQTSTVLITVTVSVPAKTLISDNIVVTLMATATMPGLIFTAVTSAQLGIAQYFEISAKSQTLTGTGNPQKFNIDINNAGNGNDTFSIDIVDRAALEKAGFRFELSQTTVSDIPPNGNASVKLTVSYGLATTSGKRDIKVLVTSMNSNQSSDKRYSVQVPVTVDVGALGGGGSQTYLIAGLIVLMVVVAFMLAVMVRRRAKVKGTKVVLAARPVKKVGDENGEDEPLKEPEEVLDDKKDAKSAEHED